MKTIGKKLWENKYNSHKPKIKNKVVIRQNLTFKSKIYVLGNWTMLKSLSYGFRMKNLT